MDILIYLLYIMSYFDKLEELVINYDWKPNPSSQKTTYFRKNSYSLNVGYSCHWRKKGAPILPSQNMKKDPRIYNECKRLFPDFKFDFVIINKNLKSPPHKDTNNTQQSLIVGLGDYNGGDLCIKEEDTGVVTNHCIFKSPMYFNGRDNLHWTDDFEGDRYVVILGSSKWKSLSNFYNKQDIDYVVAIPSYKRADILKNKTLKLLKEQKIPKNKIDIFVANEEEANIYKNTLNKYYNNIIVGVKGCAAIRNFITNYYKLGTKIVSIDDDIEDIQELHFYDQENKKANGSIWKKPKLQNLIFLGFMECIKNNCSLWGVYPVTNYFFMNLNITYDLKFILGNFFGYINKGFQVNVNTKDDYERTIQNYIEYGKVVRFNNVALKTNYMSMDGGGNSENGRPKEEAFAECDYIKTKYPDFCEINLKKKNGYADLILKDKNKKHNPPEKTQFIQLL